MDPPVGLSLSAGLGEMRFGSVCSGIEAASMAWLPLGWKPVFYSEIDLFPCAVLEQRHTTISNFGDLNKFKEWPDAAINLLVGGTPCQSFSVAGLRKGMDDPRGNLALTYLAVVDRYRPKWVVWENVPGVLSSNGGRDFGTFLGALGELGYGFAYRILDAQYFGVPQRRRRVFVVGYSGDWRPPAAVLFERYSLSGHPAPGGKTGTDITPIFEIGARTSCDGKRDGDGIGKPGDPMHTLQAGKVHGVAGAITACAFRGGGDDNMALANHVVPTTVGAMSACGGTKHKHGFGWGQQDWENGYCIPVSFQSRASASQSMNPGLVAPTIGAANGAAVAVAFTQNQGGDVLTGEVMHALGTNQNASARNAPTVMDSVSVRRLTPMECERLQGFPDNYTKISWRGKSSDNCPDGPRYKALGNSMAVPVMAWMGQRIQQVHTEVSNGETDKK